MFRRETPQAEKACYPTLGRIFSAEGVDALRC